MTISPTSPEGIIAPDSDMIATSGPAATPTLPAFRGIGGSGLEVIWWLASVMPYDSSTGHLKAASSSVITCGGSDDDDERMKRSGCAAIISALRAARARIAWCIVGTAVYQVAPASFSQPKNFKALKPGVHTTLPPAASDERTA